jgi:hypothetical protein
LSLVFLENEALILAAVNQAPLVGELVEALAAMVLADCKTAYPENHSIYFARRKADAVLLRVRKAQEAPDAST